MAISSGSSLGGPTPSDGSYSLSIFYEPNSFTSGGLIQQTLTGVTYQPNSLYTLSIDVDRGLASANIMRQARLELYEDGNLIDGLLLSSLVDSDDGFETVTLNYMTGNNPPDGELGIGLQLLVDSAIFSGEIYFDNIQLQVAAVPEPQHYVIITSCLLIAFSVLRKASNAKKAIVRQH
jgi:hypothetical protein